MIILLALAAIVVCVGRQCGWWPFLSKAGKALVERRRSMAAFRWEEVTAQELRDFDLEHPWVKRWERRWGVK